MRIFTKIFTVLRAGVRESAEAVIDANALRICEQEIHECETAIQAARHDLAGIVAEKLRLQREIAALETALRERENQAAKAVQASAETLVHSLAQAIADKEGLLAEQRKRRDLLEQHEARVLKSLRAAMARVQHYRDELRLAKATAGSQRAFQRLAGTADTVGCKLEDIEDSLTRIQRNQDDFADHFEAMERVRRHLSENVLDEQVKATLKSAEFDPVAAVLERVTRRAAGGVDSAD